MRGQMAALLPPALYRADASFLTPLHVVDESEGSACSCQSCSTTGERHHDQECHAPAAEWQPRFDFRETADSYELLGELPGVKKQDIDIALTEPQVLVVHGKIARTHTGNGSAAEASRAPAPRQASVADGKDLIAVEEEKFHVVGVGESLMDAPGAHETQATPATTPEDHQGGSKTKYWLRERRMGDFARSFHFPSRINANAIRARFLDGVLSIMVSKADQRETIRVSID